MGIRVAAVDCLRGTGQKMRRAPESCDGKVPNTG